MANVKNRLKVVKHSQVERERERERDKNALILHRPEARVSH